MNTTAHLVARALRDRQTIATTDNNLGHRIRIHEHRTTILKLVREGIIAKPCLYAAPHGLAHYRTEPPPPTATDAATAREYALNLLNIAKYRAIELEALLTTCSAHTTDSSAALLHIFTTINRKIAKISA